MKTTKQLLALTFGIGLLISLIFPSENWINGFMINTLYSAGFTLANYLFFKQIGKDEAWKKNPKKTLIFSLAGMIPLNIMVLFIMNFIVSVGIYHTDIEHFIASQNLLSYIFATLISCVIALFIINLHLVKRLRQLSHE